MTDQTFTHQQRGLTADNGRLLDAALLTLIAAAIYSVTTAPTVLPGDSGEFQFVAWLPGIAHPTGYPLYILLGWAWSQLLPFGEVAWRMNWLSAVLGGLTIGLMSLVSRRLLTLTLPDLPPLSQRLAAAFGTLTVALTPLLWSQAIIAEVYTLHSLILLGLLYSLLPPSTNSGSTNRPLNLSKSRLALTAFLFGLGLAHHRTTILLLPALVAYVWLVSRQSEPTSTGAGHDSPDSVRLSNRHAIGLRQGLILGSIAALPLTLYLYLPLIAPHTPYAPRSRRDSPTLVLYENSWSGFWNHITGAAFQGSLRPFAVDGSRLLMAGEILRQQVGIIGLMVAALGIVTLFRARNIPLLLLTGLSFVTLVSFNLMYFIGDIEVLFIPPTLILGLWIALGSAGLVDWLARRFVTAHSRANVNPYTRPLQTRISTQAYSLVTAGLLLPSLLLPLWMLATQFDTLTQADNRAAETGWQRILAEPLPTGAILVSNDRNDIMPLWYFQYVAQQRPDLIGLFPRLNPDPSYANIGRVLDQALATSRPVYLIKPMPGLAVKAALTPDGALWRVRPHPTPSLHENQPTLADALRLVGYETQADSDGLRVTLHWQPLRPLNRNYTTFVHLLDETGQPITQHDHRPGGVFYPTRYWQVTEILRDEHRLTVEADVLGQRYQLRIGGYHLDGAGQLSPLGEAIIIEGGRP